MEKRHHPRRSAADRSRRELGSTSLCEKLVLIATLCQMTSVPAYSGLGNENANSVSTREQRSQDPAGTLSAKMERFNNDGVIVTFATSTVTWATTPAISSIAARNLLLGEAPGAAVGPDQPPFTPLRSPQRRPAPKVNS
jgi:hypothetical protein